MIKSMGERPQASTLQKELQATKKYWKQEKSSFPENSTPIGYLLLDG